MRNIAGRVARTAGGRCLLLDGADRSGDRVRLLFLLIDPVGSAPARDRFFEQPSYGEDIKQLTRARAEDPREYRFGVTVYPASDPRLGEILAALGRRLGVARLGPGSRDPAAPPFAPDTLGAEEVKQ